MNTRRSGNIPKALIPKLLYYLGRFLQRNSRFVFHEFRHFFSTPKNGLSQNFWLTTRYHINSMGLWCAVGIAIIHLIYYLAVISDLENLPNFNVRLQSDGFFTPLRNFNYALARRLQNSGLHLVNSILFTLFLILWLYVHYSHGRMSKRNSFLFCLFYVAANNLVSLTSLSPSFANVWLIMTPIIVIPAVGNRYSLPLLLLNIALHHLSTSYGRDPYGELTSIASFFVAIFIMMMQIEYYRREVRLQESASRLRERALEIKLIKENMDSGLMLLDQNLQIRPNFSDRCIKLLHKKNLRKQYFPLLLRNIVEENRYFIQSMNYGADPEGDEYIIGDLGEWQERIEHYFEMLKAEQLDDDELSSIDPLKYIKIYSYEGRSYISFHISAIKVQDQIQYFMVLISDDTGKVAGRYRILEHERKSLENAQLLLALAHNDPMQQLGALQGFARSYLKLCKNILTEVRSHLPPMQLLDTVIAEFQEMKSLLSDLNLSRYADSCSELLRKCHNFTHVELEHHSNAVIINKSVQILYIQLIVDCERFLHGLRSLFSLATFFIREPRLIEELQQQKQSLHYGLSQDTLQSEEIIDFYDTPLSEKGRMLINLYTAFKMLISRQDLQQELALVERNSREREAGPRQDQSSGT